LLCKGEDLAKTIYTSLVSRITGNKTNMLQIIFLCLIATLTLVSGKCDVGTQNMDDFDWTKVGVTLFTGFMKETTVEILFLFSITKPQYRLSE
jgi:hypothetical protein